MTGCAARRLTGERGVAVDGDLALNYWRPYDDRVGLEGTPDDPESIASECRALGVAVELVPGDLSDPAVPAEVIRAAGTLGPVTGLVMLSI